MTAERQYGMWVFRAIVQARKSSNGIINDTQVASMRDPNIWFSFKQWATAAGWLTSVSATLSREGRKATGLTNTEIYNQLVK